MKQRKTGKVQFLFFRKFLLVLTKFPNFLSIELFGNSYLLCLLLTITFSQPSKVPKRYEHDYRFTLIRFFCCWTPWMYIKIRISLYQYKGHKSMAWSFQCQKHCICKRRHLNLFKKKQRHIQDSHKHLTRRVFTVANH